MPVTLVKNGRHHNEHITPWHPKHSHYISIEFTDHLFSSLLSAIDLNKCPHLQDLQLTDEGGDNKESIDMLIGLNFYWKIVIGDLRRGEYGPTTINSKFGCLLSWPNHALGPIESTHVHMIITGDLDNSRQQISKNPWTILEDWCESKYDFWLFWILICFSTITM